MRSFRHSAALAAIPLALISVRAWASNPTLSPQDEENFLKTAKVLKNKSTDKGITGTVRMTLSDGTITHDAQLQTIDEKKSVFQSDRGVELNFRDTYRFNIAAYKLAQLLGIGDRLPMSVERNIGGHTGAVTWWIDNVKFDEQARLKMKAQPPDPEDWNRQMNIVRVFDQLIYNTDRNLGNLVIDQDWKIWMIDHTRAFRLQKTLLDPKNLVTCDRDLLDKMRQLDAATLQRELVPYIGKPEIDGLLARRDLIVKKFAELAQEKGEAQVFYTSAKR